jgi:hypothetical protein
MIGVTIEASPFSRAKKQAVWERKKIEPSRTPDCTSFIVGILPSMKG